MRGRRTRAGEPVNAGVGQQLVTVDRFVGRLGGRVGPLLELLHDPGELTGRRVVYRVGQGLWTRRLQRKVAGAVLAEGVEPLGAGPVGRREPVQGERGTERGRRARAAE